jgi:hypothetical protein
MALLRDTISRDDAVAVDLWEQERARDTELRLCLQDARYRDAYVVILL